MTNVYYDQYIKGIFSLSSTMVIKSEATAEANNSYLELLGYTVSETDPRTWRYYLNLAGEYHRYDFPMTVVSMDTMEEIPFTKETLRLHRGTKRAYSYGTRYYKELVAKYPKQVRLIDGILNPVDMEKAIAASDHTILYYDENLVEDHEVTLIDDLQRWIYAAYDRWNVPDYHFGEEYFSAAQIAVISSHLPKTILNLRLKNCKTEYAHTFHMRQYLSSFGNLGDYFDYMTHAQRLFFYRNILWLNLNCGKTSTFKLLTQKVLTDRLFPLGSYELQKNIEELSERLRGVVQFQRKELNGLPMDIGKDILTTEEIFALTRGRAKGNASNERGDLIDMERRANRSLLDTMKTKVLESSFVDTSNSDGVDLADVVLNHWAYFSHIGYYNTMLTTINPTSNETLVMSAKDAWYLYLYLYNKARGVELETLPVFECKNVVRIPQPSAEELRSVASYQYVDDEFIREALDMAGDVENYISVESFREACVAIKRQMENHRQLAVLQMHLNTRAEVLQMVDRFYMHFGITVNETVPYSTWLEEKGFKFADATPMELDAFAATVLSLATGSTLSDDKSVREIHTAMVKIMEQLSSYNVQYVSRVVDSQISVIERGHLRYGDSSETSRDLVYVEHSLVRPWIDLSGVRDVGEYALVRHESTWWHSEVYRRDRYQIGLEHTFKAKSYQLMKGWRHQLTHVEQVEPVVDLSTLQLGEVGYHVPADTPLVAQFHSTQTAAPALTEDDYRVFRYRLTQ